MQIEDQIAVDGGALDSTVVWDITADQGYSLDIEDFSFTGATQITSSTNPTIWKDLPSPIVGAFVHQISSVLIRIHLVLKPDGVAFNFGNTFVMPGNDVNVTVPIEGCAMIAAHSMRLWFNEPAGNNTITEITVNPDLEKRLAQVGEGEGGLKSHEVVGTLPPQALDKVASSSGDYLMSYVVVASSGYRYTSTPTLSINSKLYNVESFAQLTPSPYEEGKNNITGVRFEIYKK
tara:strand:- start:5766 stop:6464 length:699 start_codon:yes stop_codon:yes gene_type:complete